MLEIVEKLEMLEIIDCWAGVQLKSCDALSTAEESEIHFIGGREQKYKIQKNTEYKILKNNKPSLRVVF